MHEITHHFVCQRLFRLSKGGARKPAFWVNEGIATFIESLKRPRKDKIDFDAIDSQPRIGVGYRLSRPQGGAEAPGGHGVRDVLADGALPGQRRRRAIPPELSAMVDGSRDCVDGSAGLAAALGLPFPEIQVDLPAHLWRMSLSK
jgi:hypothetical protein